MKTALLPTGAVIASHFKVSYATVSLLTAAPLILAVLTGFLSAILARLCGKRPLYLVGTLLTLIGCIWSVTITASFASCLGARLFQGLGWGIFDTLVLSSMQDTYFVRASSFADSYRLLIHFDRNISVIFASHCTTSSVSLRPGDLL